MKHKEGEGREKKRTVEKSTGPTQYGYMHNRISMYMYVNSCLCMQKLGFLLDMHAYVHVRGSRRK